MEITHNNGALCLSQSRYAVDLLEKFDIENCSPCPTPLPCGTLFKQHDGDPLLDPTIYRSIVGSLQYLTLSRSDITFVVNHASQFLQHPCSGHLKAIKRILCYIKGTIQHGLVFKNNTSL